METALGIALDAKTTGLKSAFLGANYSVRIGGIGANTFPRDDR